MPIRTSRNELARLPENAATAADATTGGDDEPIVLDPDDWPVIEPFNQTSDPPALDMATAIPPCLPNLATFIGQTSIALQVPMEMVAPLVMSIASLGVSRSLEVECQTGWREPAPLWVACLASPGERKSALLSMIAEPVHAWQKREREHLRVELAKYMEERRQLEARLAGLRSSMSRKPGAKGEVGPCLGDLQRQAEGLVEELEGMPELRMPDLITADATPEAARDLLGRNGEKLGIIAAEGDQLDVLLGRYGEGKANLGLFLNGHAGDPCPAHRVGRDMPLERPALVCSLAVQPQAVETMLANPEAVGRGLVARFMFIKPRSWLGKRLLEPAPMDSDVVEWWRERIVRLLSMTWPGKVVIGPDGPMRCRVPARILTLSPGAYQCHLALRAELEPRIEPEHGDLSFISAFASKLPGAIARISLAFQALADVDAKEITEDCMRAACAWAPFLLGHAQAIMGGTGDPEGALARKVWRWIEKGKRWTFTAGECYRENRSAIVDHPTVITTALEILMRHGLIRQSEMEQSKGRRADRYEVNPLAQNALNTQKGRT
jgi:hypothetical protein